MSASCLALLVNIEGCRSEDGSCKSCGHTHSTLPVALPSEGEVQLWGRGQSAMGNMAASIAFLVIKYLIGNKLREGGSILARSLRVLPITGEDEWSLWTEVCVRLSLTSL